MKKKILISVLCLLFIVVFNFALPRLMPGDPVLMLLGMDDSIVSQSQYEYYYHELGLDKSLPSQFINYLLDIVSGNLGYSYHYDDSVASLIGNHLPVTLYLSIPSILVASLLSLFIGSYMGYKKGSLPERGMTWINIVVHAIPSFLWALLFLYLFAFKLRWFPLGALNSRGITAGSPGFLYDRFYHLALPVLVLILLSFPSKYMMMVNRVGEERKMRYVIYARSQGLSSFQIVYSHILKNILPQFITMAGMSFGSIFTGSLIVENIFSLQGMGMHISEAITARDYPVLEGCLLISSLVVVLFTLLADLVCFFIDPKVRYKVYEEK